MWCGVEYNKTTKVEQSLWLRHITFYSNNPIVIWIYVSLDKQDLDRHDMGKGGVKMILVDRYDHRIYHGRKETSWKEIELIL
jgi:hypothetical protein